SVATCRCPMLAEDDSSTGPARRLVQTDGFNAALVPPTNRIDARSGSRFIHFVKSRRGRDARPKGAFNPAGNLARPSSDHGDQRDKNDDETQYPDSLHTHGVTIGAFMEEMFKRCGQATC